jgi:hypothetical protein
LNPLPLFAGEIAWKEQGLDNDRHHARRVEPFSDIDEVQFA